MNHILESPASLFSIRTCPYMRGLSEQLYHVLQHCRLEDLHWAFFLPFQSWCRTADWHCCLHTRHATLLQDHNKTRLWSQFRLAWTESHLLCYKLDMQASHFLAYFGSVGLNHVCSRRIKFRYMVHYPQPAFRADISSCVPPHRPRESIPARVPPPPFGIGYHRVTEMGRRLEDADWDGRACFICIKS